MATQSVRYNISSTNQGLSVATHLGAPSYSQDTMWNFLKSKKAREFASGLGAVNMQSWLLSALSIPTIAGGVVAAGYALYYQNLVNQIYTLSDQYPGVIIKVITAAGFGTSYSVTGWNDITTAVVYLTNDDTAHESVTGAYFC